MKIAPLLLLALIVFLPSMQAQQPPAGAGYKLVWSDDFNGTSLDEARWQYRTDTKFLSTQLPKNVKVENGYLVISLLKEKTANKEYTGGGVISRQSFRYGYYEASFKVVTGWGWHSSFWLMNYNNKNTQGDKTTLELDVIENYSVDLSSYTVNSIRWSPPHRDFGWKRVKSPDLSKDFHTFGCEYQPDVVRYFLDGKLVQTVDTTGMPQGNMNIWLTSIAEAQGPSKDVDDSVLPGKMIVDWVRFYSR
jgi:beta-glucanase (GH16 family)